MQFIYLEVDCGRGDTFFLGKDNTSHTKDLEYNYGEDYLTIKAKARYADGRYCSTQTFTSFGQNAIPLNEAGVYKLEQRYKDPQGGPDIVFNLNVTVKERRDLRPTPLIDILPDEDCVSYEKNKKYVYEYDGEYHLPKYCEAYLLESSRTTIATFDVRACVVDATVVEGDENNALFKDVGVYKFDLLVYSPNFGIGGDNGRYAPTKIIGVVIEIRE